MSTIKVDALQDTSGNGFYPARAWANVNQIGTQSIRADENISSITDSGTGVTDFTFGAQPSNANYAAPSSSGDASVDAARMALTYDGSNVSTTSFRIRINDASSASQDADYVLTSVFWN